MTTSIALLCMTKNGQGKIPALLKSVQGLVDKAYFLETSDSSATADWLTKAALTSYPLFVRRSKFVDFAVSRNELFNWAKAEQLRLADRSWFLLLDDDMVLNQETQKEAGDLTAYQKVKLRLCDPKNIGDCYLLRHADPKMDYWVTRLIRAELNWEYRGVTHEYLWPHRLQGRIEEVSIQHNHIPNKEKFERDLTMLSADIARDPNDPRTIFYLANTLRDKGEKEAAKRFFVMRALMGGWEEEIYVSMYEAARLSDDPNLMEKAAAYRGSRAEPAYWLTHYYTKQGNEELAAKWEATRKSIPMSTDILFVQRGAYHNESPIIP